MGPLRLCRTIVPCGHTLCGACFSAAGAEDGNCPECGDACERAIEVESLEQVATKLAFQRYTLATLAAIQALAEGDP